MMHRSSTFVLTTILTILISAVTANAQAPPAPETPPHQTKDPRWWVAEGRACEACPRRSVGKALFQTTIVNVAYELANLFRGQVTAEITPKTWWANMEQGWVWDLDDFTVNQIGHPYQGSNYFNTGRANGLSFYESAAVTAFGSGTWEYFGETNHASLNDFINTTLGGIALGEMFHRAGWLVRNTHATGKKRLWGEIGAMALDPITGANRFITGDASRVADKPADLVPSSLAGVFSAGALWRGTNENAFSGSADAFLEMDLLYGDPTVGRSRNPYDAFSVRFMFGGGSAFSEARVQGRLLGQPFKDDRVELLVVQGYEYQANDAYRYGAQSFNATLAVTAMRTPRNTLWLAGWGGLTVLGAVDSLPVELEEAPDEPEPPEGEGPGQGVSEGPRFYDYGPGSNFGALAQWRYRNQRIAAFSYEGRHLYSLDGVRANHVLQRLRLDLLAPLHRKFGVGVTGEYFDRRTYYQDAARTVKKFHYPQFRVYFTWSVS
jgi:hypothetical protein